MTNEPNLKAKITEDIYAAEPCRVRTPTDFVVLVDGMTAANDLGLIVAIPTHVAVHTDARGRSITFGNLTIEFKLTASSKLYPGNLTRIFLRGIFSSRAFFREFFSFLGKLCTLAKDIMSILAIFWIFSPSFSGFRQAKSIARWGSFAFGPCRHYAAVLVMEERVLHEL